MLHAQKPVFATAIALFVSLTVFGSAKPELVFSPKPETFAPAEKPWPASAHAQFHCEHQHPQIIKVDDTNLLQSGLVNCISGIQYISIENTQPKIGTSKPC